MEISIAGIGTWLPQTVRTNADWPASFAEREVHEGDRTFRDIPQSEDPEWREEAFEAPLAPDMLHKADISGGAPYAVRLPDGRADAALRNVSALVPDASLPGGLGVDVPEPNETLVGYLRRSFRWAGFPGFEALPGRPDDMLAALRRGLLPL